MKGDFRIVDQGGHNVVPTKRVPTEAAGTQILVGEPVKIGGTGNNYAVPLATAEPIVGTTAGVLGIAASDSTETATADGYVDVYMPLPGVIYSAKATTAANVNTDAKIAALTNDTVGVDLTGGVYTIDEDDIVADGFNIVGGNSAEGTLKVELRGSASSLN